MKRLYAVLPLLLLAVAGCGTAGSGGVGADDTTSIELKGTWVVSDISENGTPRDPVEGTQIQLEFDDRQLRIAAGCNSMSAEVTRAGTRLDVGPLMGTKMRCAPAPDGPGRLAGRPFH